MGQMAIEQTAAAMASIPRDAQSRKFLRDLLTNSDSVLTVLKGLGMRLSPTERKFLNRLPPMVDGAIRGAIANSLQPANRAKINFDVAYRSRVPGHALTISATRAGEVDVVLHAPTPGRAVSRSKAAKAKPKARTKAGAGKRKPARKKAPARKGRR
jgi:hypothetical protein